MVLCCSFLVCFLSVMQLWRVEQNDKSENECMIHRTHRHYTLHLQKKMIRIKPESHSCNWSWWETIKFLNICSSHSLVFYWSTKKHAYNQYHRVDSMYCRAHVGLIFRASYHTHKLWMQFEWSSESFRNNFVFFSHILFSILEHTFYCT